MKPVFVKDHITIHREETFHRGGPRPQEISHPVAAFEINAEILF